MMLLVSVFFPRRIGSIDLRSDLSSPGGVLNVDWIPLRWNLLIHLHRLLSNGLSDYMAPSEGFGSSSHDSWAGTEDGITNIRRRVRRRGQTIQKPEEREGNFLEENETRRPEIIDTLHARILKEEIEVRKPSKGNHRYMGDQMMTSAIVN
jgi:hypothetical protein